jgi:lipopolysaccharide/colanic/teichoic acid biosynthesis glycosyltransferase
MDIPRVFGQHSSGMRPDPNDCGLALAAEREGRCAVMRDSSSNHFGRSITTPMERLLNTVLAVALLVLTAPLLTIVALTIRLETAGPILVSRMWINRSGRRIELLRFRAAQWEEGRERSGSITRVGYFLQQTRIELLPQLLNVLRGEMTLIDMNDS